MVRKKPTKKRTVQTRSSAHQMMELLGKISDATTTQNDRLIAEMNTLTGEMAEMKEMLSRLKVTKRSRRGIFGHRRVEVAVQEPPKKSGVSFEELMPLLPQLSNFIPQLNNAKMSETLKILSNPAVMRMVQQFMANGGLKKLHNTNTGRK